MTMIYDITKGVGNNYPQKYRCIQNINWFYYEYTLPLYHRIHKHWQMMPLPLQLSAVIFPVYHKNRQFKYINDNKSNYSSSQCLSINMYTVIFTIITTKHRCNIHVCSHCHYGDRLITVSKINKKSYLFIPYL